MKRSNEVTVGILITVAVVVLVVGTLWLARGGLKSGYPLYTRFAWGQNLKQGQPVLLAGVSVGYVGDVELRRSGYLDVTLQIDDQYTVPKGSTATVKAVGIFGDVAVALTPTLPVPPTNYAPGDTVPPGAPAADISQIMNRVDSIGMNVAALTLALKEQFVDAGTLEELHRTVASASALSAELQRAIRQQNANMTVTMHSFANAADHLSHIVDSSQVNATLANLQETSANAARLTANIDSTNAQLRMLIAQAQSGDGTIGKLMRDSLLYMDIRHTVASLDSLLIDFKKNPKKYINLRIF